MSRLADSAAAAREVTESVATQFQGASPDLTCLFLSRHHGDRVEKIIEELSERLQSRLTIGCTGESIIGGAEEIEEGPALSVWSASMPGTRFVPIHVTFEETPDGIACLGFPDVDEVVKESATSILLLGEPFSCDPRGLIERFADVLPGVPIVGGMASGGGGPGENRLILDEAGNSSSSLKMEGAVGVIICGGSALRTVVSQGCKPIGKPFVVTKAEKNVVFELGGLPPLEQLKLFFDDLSEEDRGLVRQGLHLGIAMSEYRDQFGRGDFLVSNVIGVDPDRGAIAIGNRVRVGQTVQYHIRDAASADEDLVQLLEAERSRREESPRGALIFSCNGRGTRLFPEPHHDAHAVKSVMGDVSVAGFFAQGEFGPVAGANYIHGYTASVALFD